MSDKTSSDNEPNPGQHRGRPDDLPEPPGPPDTPADGKPNDRPPSNPGRHISA